MSFTCTRCNEASAVTMIPDPLCQVCSLVHRMDRFEASVLSKIPDLVGVRRALGGPPLKLGTAYKDGNFVRGVHPRAVVVGAWPIVAPYILKAIHIAMFSVDITTTKPLVKVVTDAELRAAYFAENPRGRPGEETPPSVFATLTMEPKVLVIRLGHYAHNNPALPGLIHEAVCTRDRFATAHGLTTWVQIDPAQPWTKSHKAFSSELDALLKAYEWVTITEPAKLASDPPAPMASNDRQLVSTLLGNDDV